MQRRRIVLIAGFLAVLAAVLPLAGIATYARYRATQAERTHLTEYADWTLRRAERNFDRAKEVFAQVEGDGWKTCSEAHIARMRQLALDSAAVEEVGYFIGGKLACTSWGVVRQDIGHGTPDAQVPGGYGFFMNVRPKVSGGNIVIAITHGDYNVLVNRERFVDVMTDTPMTLALATRDGKLIAVNGDAGEAIAREAIGEGGFGHLGAHVYTSVRSPNFEAVAITDRALIQSRIDRELWVLVPLGLAISAFLVGLIVWLSRQRMSLEHELELAIRNREFRVLYQPIMELATGLCVGAEALLRWEQPDGTAVSPEVFIPLAEQNGLIAPLTDFVIEQVVADLADMLRRERSVHVAVNISAADIQSGRFLPVLAQALAASGVAPRQIWLEATERGFMDAAQARGTLEQARAAGHLVAIDDFGTGYSSLALLEALPLDALKIDKSFVDAIGQGAATSVVVPHIIEIAHGLTLKIVAEGVETPEQEAYLRAAGVGFAQGWLYAKALDAKAFLAFQQTTNGKRVSPFLTAIAS